VASDLGDIPHLSFDPATGREMKGDHCCIVLIPKAFNARFASHGSIP
jgi:mRNA interferase ChpB